MISQNSKLDYNELNGTIPLSIGDLTQLRDLYAYFHPICFALSPHLTLFTRKSNLNDNELAGSIPQRIGNLLQLRNLYVDILAEVDPLVNPGLTSIIYNSWQSIGWQQINRYDTWDHWPPCSTHLPVCIIDFDFSANFLDISNPNPETFFCTQLGEQRFTK